MKILVEEVNQVQRRVKVELASATVQTAFDAAYRKAQKKAHIKGFRPGKAPLNIIKKFYSQSVAMDVADNLVRNHLFEALREQALNPISTPVLESMEMPEEGKAYNFAALVDIMPALSVTGYKGLKLSYQKMPVDASALDREMEVIRRQYAKMKDVADTTVCKSGHYATISHKAFKADGSVVGDLTTDELPLEVGKGQVIKDIDDALVGMKQGDAQTVTVELPDDYNDQDLAGQTIKVELSMSKLQELVIPPEDDDLAKDAGFESLAKLREHMQKLLEENAVQHKRNQLEEELLKQLAEKNPFEVPPALVDQVIDAHIDGLRWPNDQERQKAKGDASFRNRFLQISKLKAKNTMILHEVIKAEKLEVGEDDLDQYFLQMFGGQEQQPDKATLAKLKKSYATQARENLLLKKALDFVIDQADVKERPADKK